MLIFNKPFKTHSDYSVVSCKIFVIIFQLPLRMEEKMCIIG